MPDIYHDFPIMAPIQKVFAVIASPDGMAEWWTMDSSGEPGQDNEYTLDFGPGYEWTGRVTEFHEPDIFEITLIDASDDWDGSRIRFELEDRNYGTNVRFVHAGWADRSDHFRTSSFCWAMYLRVLKRFIEHGEQVPYDKRLTV